MCVRLVKISCDDLGDDPGDNLGKISAISVTILGSDDRQPGSAWRFQRVLIVNPFPPLIVSETIRV